MRVLALLGCVLTCSLLASVSSAQEDALAAAVPSGPPPAPTYAPPSPTYGPTSYYPAPPPGYYYAPIPRKRTWYGWQTLATDGAAFLSVYAAAESRGGGGGEGMAYLGLGLYTVGAPIVHMAHNNPGRGIASLAIRSLPALMIFGEPQYNEGLLLLTVLSVPTIIAVDAAALAREDEEPPPRTYGARVVPTASASKNGGLVGLAGVF